MAYEIERKFLVRDESWREKAGKPALILQAYLARTGTISLRVRIKDSIRATLRKVGRSRTPADGI